MSTKIYLSPSNQTANVGSYQNTNEHEQCERIAIATKRYLEQGYKCEVKVAARADTMQKRVLDAKAFGAEVYIPIHTNAFSDKTVRGTETFYHSSDARGKALAAELLNAVSGITGVKRRAKSYDGLYELSEPDCTRAYLEVDFHSNPERAAWITENTELIANTIAETTAQFLSLDKLENTNADNADIADMDKTDILPETKEWILANLHVIFAVIMEMLKK